MSRRSTLEVTIESCPTCSFKPKVEYFVELVKDKLGDAVNVTFTDAPRGNTQSFSSYIFIYMV